MSKFPYFVPPDINGKEQDPVVYLYQRLLEQQHQIDTLGLELRFLKQKVTPAFENTRKAEGPALGSAPRPTVVPIMDGVTGEVVATFEVPKPVIEVVQDKPAEVELVINEEWRRALNMMDMGTDHIFITGKAGCLSGDTVVEINRGGASKKITMSRLHHMLQGGMASGKIYDLTIPTRIRSLTQDDIVGLGVIAQSVFSGRKITYTVETIDGNQVRATADHRFLTVKGWRQLKDLFVGDLLIVDGGKPKTTLSRQDRRKYYPSVVNMSNHPYSVSRGKKKRWASVPRHRVVYEAQVLNDMEVEEFVMWVQEGYTNGLKFVNPNMHDVHHKDENPENNSIDNLLLMTKQEHLVYHAMSGSWKHCQARVKTSKIKSISQYGMEETFDLTIADGMQPNFLANGIVVHNSGKTTLLTKWTGETYRNAPIVAPTGIAALRAGGQTIHSFFRFEARAMDSDYIPDLREKDILKLQNLDDLIIDEVSMVRPDLMDAIQRTLSKYGPHPGKPFGGVRLIMIGDLYQLPPVVADTDKKNKPVQTFMVDHYGTKTPYFFHADCWRDKPPAIHELTHVFRQSDMAFVDALNAIREGSMTDLHLNLLNARTNRDFVPPVDEVWMRLVTTNAKVQEANELMLQQLPGEGRIFEANVTGDFGEESSGEKYPTERTLELKPGALVMFVKNDKDKRWVNGTTGRVLEVSPILTIEVNGIGRVVTTDEWESVTYEYDRKAHKIKKIVKGTFRQIPVKVAAAATIHKTQGMTLDRAILDLSWGTFADGQLYVGLSRLKSLEGLVLARSIKMDDLKVNGEVLKFMHGGEIARPVTQAF